MILRPTMTRLSLLFLALILAPACSSKAQRARVSKRVNRAYLAPIAAKDRAAVHEGQVRSFLAEWQLHHSEGKLRDAESQAAIAKNNVKQAKLALDSARVLLKSANEGSDTNKIAEAQKAEAIAVSELELAKAKLERSKVHRNYLKARVDHDHAENELAKAEIEAAKCATPDEETAKEDAKELYVFAEEKAAAGEWTTAMYAYEDAYFLVPAKVGFAYKVGVAAFEARRCSKAAEYLDHFAQYGDPERHAEMLAETEGMQNRLETLGCGQSEAPPEVKKKGCSIDQDPSLPGAASLLCLVLLRRRRS